MFGGIGTLGRGVDPDHVAAILSRRATHPLATYREEMPAFPRAEQLARRYISCVGKPPGAPLVAVGAGLRAAGWRVDDIAAGRFAAVTSPDALVELLDR